MLTPHADQTSLSVCCAVITVSDTRDETTDRSGQLMRSQLINSGHTISSYQIVKDEPKQIAALVITLANRLDVQAILLNGGTGIAARDTTFDAITPLLDKELPGFGELFRHLSYLEIGSRAMASRAIAGTRGQTLIFSLPGSTKAVGLALEKLILPELQHLTNLLR
ncbi:hypothetical protein S7335_2799 [Synechococcus sp. PCC 7335]|uniref:MogA/MoaB family molybdenum cofactor biosynthesis protein n=1 Tax=Synechococcus sp. (strain ATCC 29403 / PCC 7335) TaxID=91464 RepID=UPI00017EE80E|nr:MogA/MoaB family molybdenum cofactor biosynthesis protein [Synechococcus sp. PCC 7335]EDX85100.1 hypothetical protein S7335_2799 [Synechococcus sp. PCC 7335]